MSTCFGIGPRGSRSGAMQVNSPQAVALAREDLPDRSIGSRSVSFKSGHAAESNVSTHMPGISRVKSVSVRFRSMPSAARRHIHSMASA